MRNNKQKTLIMSLVCATALGLWCGGAVGEVQQDNPTTNENLLSAQNHVKALQAAESSRKKFPVNTTSPMKSIAPMGAPNDDQVWNLKDVDIRTLINEVSKITGKDFIVAPDVDAKVTFIAKQALSPDELYQAFQTVLRTYGFLAIPEGRVVKIVSDKTPNRLSSPVAPRNLGGLRSEMAVTTIRVKNYPAADLVRVIQPLMPRYSFIDVYRPSNSLIIADHADNIAKVQELVARLDFPVEDKLEVIHLKNSSASDLVQSLTKLFVSSSSPANNRLGLQLSADDHTNSILMYGGTREQRLEVRATAAKLDINFVSNRDNMEVFYLRYIPAETVAPVLQGVVDNYFANLTQAEKITTQGAVQGTPGGTLGGGGATTQPSTLSRATNLLNPSSPPVTNQSSSFGGTTASSTTGSFGQDVQTGKTFAPPRSGSLSPYIQWEESTNSIIVTGPVALIQKLRHVVAKLDIRLPQVLIEVVIAEVTLGQEKDLGVEWSFKGNYQAHTRYGNPAAEQNLSDATSTFPTATALGTLGTGLTLGFLSNNDLRAVVRALHTDSRSNILATPNLVTLDNQEAIIKVGQKVSFATSQINNNPTGGNPLTTFDREDVGLILVIKPQITPDGAVKLLIQQEISSILPNTAQSNAVGNPNTTERFISTMVMAKNNQTIVLGGLLQNQWDGNVEKVPYLGDLPLVGFLFRAKQNTSSKTNLMIFMRPVIMSDDRTIANITGGKYEFLRQQQIHTEQPHSDLLVAPTVPLRKETQLTVPGCRPPLRDEPCPPMPEMEPPRLLEARTEFSSGPRPVGRIKRDIILPQRLRPLPPPRRNLPVPEMFQDKG